MGDIWSDLFDAQGLYFPCFSARSIAQDKARQGRARRGGRGRVALVKAGQADEMEDEEGDERRGEEAEWN